MKMILGRGDWLILRNSQVVVVADRGLFESLVWVYRPGKQGNTYAIPVSNIRERVSGAAPGVSHGFGETPGSARCGAPSVPGRPHTLVHESFIGCPRCKAMGAEDVPLEALRRDDIVLLTRILRETGNSVDGVVAEVKRQTGRQITAADVQRWCKIGGIHA